MCLMLEWRSNKSIASFFTALELNRSKSKSLGYVDAWFERVISDQ